jgi:hypothetical protein
VILILLLCGLLVWELWLGLCVQEDAFISFRYAENLVAGHGLVFNPGERVEGYTNFLWTVLMAGGMALELDPVPLSRYLGMIASLALVVLVFRSAQRRDAARGRTAGLLAAALVAASPAVAGEGVQGLETVFFALLVTGAVLLAVQGRSLAYQGQAGGNRGQAVSSREQVGSRREQTGNRPEQAGSRCKLLIATLLFVLAALTRPEGVGVFALATAGGLWWRWRQGMSWFDRSELGSLLLFVVLYGAYWWWRFDYYGYPFPNTFYVKTGGGWKHVLRGLAYEWRFLRLNPVLFFLTLWALGTAFSRWRRRRHHPGPEPGHLLGNSPFVATALCVVVGYLLYVVVVGGDFKKTFRFIIPVLPLWALLIDAAVSRYGWPAWPWRRGETAADFASDKTTSPAAAADRPGKAPGTVRPRWVATGTAWFLLIAVVLNGLFSAPSNIKWARRRAWDLTRRTAAGQYLAAHARPEATLAIHSAGIIPFYSGLVTIDMWGLNDLHIGHRKMPDMGGEWPPGHEKRDDAYVFSRQPTYVVDEWFYVVSDSIGDLPHRIGVDLAALGVLDQYRARSVPLQLDDGTGLQRYWFNFLERIE